MRYTLWVSIFDVTACVENAAESNEVFDLIEWVLKNAVDLDSNNVYTIMDNKNNKLYATLTRGRTPNRMRCMITGDDEPITYYIYTNDKNEYVYRVA